MMKSGVKVANSYIGSIKQLPPAVQFSSGLQTVLLYALTAKFANEMHCHKLKQHFFQLVAFITIITKHYRKHFNPS